MLGAFRFSDEFSNVDRLSLAPMPVSNSLKHRVLRTLSILVLSISFSSALTLLAASSLICNISIYEIAVATLLGAALLLLIVHLSVKAAKGVDITEYGSTQDIICLFEVWLGASGAAIAMTIHAQRGAMCDDFHKMLPYATCAMARAIVVLCWIASGTATIALITNNMSHTPLHLIRRGISLAKYNCHPLPIEAPRSVPFNHRTVASRKNRDAILTPVPIRVRERHDRLRASQVKNVTCRPILVWPPLGKEDCDSAVSLV